MSQSRSDRLEEEDVRRAFAPGAGREPDPRQRSVLDGREVPAEIVFTAPGTRVASPLADQLGCDFSDGMTGRYITVDAMQQTSVAGVFAARDAATAMFNATIASAAGVMAGVSAHRALVLEDAAVGTSRP